MFGCNVNRIGKYDFNAKKFQTAYEYLRNTDLNALESGARIEFDGGVYAMVQAYTTLPANERRFETHDKHFDIQFIISGQEACGLADRAALTVSEAYNAESDVTFYAEPDYAGEIGLRAGDFVIVAPEDAHKPHCDMGGPHPVKKIVFKIPVD